MQSIFARLPGSPAEVRRGNLQICDLARHSALGCRGTTGPLMEDGACWAARKPVSFGNVKVTVSQRSEAADQSQAEQSDRESDAAQRNATHVPGCAGADGWLLLLPPLPAESRRVSPAAGAAPRAVPRADMTITTSTTGHATLRCYIRATIIIQHRGRMSKRDGTVMSRFGLGLA